MKVLKLAAVIDASGNLHLDIPTELSAGTVDVVIVLNPSIPENLKEKSYDFSDLAGGLSWEGDNVAMQRVLRDEW
ncbi:hypothetical protein I8751_05330 [Nostocaceae cyanobacterium CENA357]|uniref:Uncharacterized protein n=1 Tax=Atlanticothrix silvestris CENA357 TaxID=1725252 RepID=A0A8J7L2J6_9CYAN|nr:hypothetical protein [Atlanticothrix silvestris]MBH8551807.1 hypothetical protein [Atlanticothrix silvestris CENA357]